VTEAVIVSTARTGLGKSWKGAFNMTYGATLGAHSVRHAVERAGVDPAEVEDVIMGSTFGEGTTGGNIARAIALRAGLPTSTAGLSVNRFCSSGLQSIALAAQRIMTEGAAVIVAGGVESISCVQNEANTHMRRDPWLIEHKPTLYWNMLQTAETVAKRYHIAKDAQDEYGVRSQLRAAAAQAAGKFKDEIAPMTTLMGVVDKNTGAIGTREVTIAAYVPTPRWRPSRKFARPCRAGWSRPAMPASSPTAAVQWSSWTPSGRNSGVLNRSGCFAVSPSPAANPMRWGWGRSTPCRGSCSAPATRSATSICGN
jgi:hypothetical protein